MHSILLYEYRPNGATVPACSYDGSSVSRLGREIGLQKYRGYAIVYRDFRLREKFAVVFEKDSKLYVDVGDGAAELLPQAAVITGALFWHRVRIQTSDGAKTIEVFTAPHRYLTNDGMFMEDVEPVLHLMERLTDLDKRQRFVKIFTGRWDGRED